MNTENLNFDMIGLAVKNDNYKFVEMPDMQSDTFASIVKEKYSDIIELNKLIDEQSQVMHNCTHLNPKEFFNLTDEELDERDKFYDIEGGIRTFKTLTQVFKFSYVDKIYLFENNKWYVAEPTVIRYMLNSSKIDDVTLNDLKEL